MLRDAGLLHEGEQIHIPHKRQHVMMINKQDRLFFQSPVCSEAGLTAQIRDLYSAHFRTVEKQQQTLKPLFIS